MFPLEKSASASHGLCGNRVSISATMRCWSASIVAVARQLHQQVEPPRAILVVRIGQAPAPSAGVSRFSFRSHAAAATAKLFRSASLKPWRAPAVRDTAPAPRCSARRCNRHRPGCAARPRQRRLRAQLGQPCPRNLRLAAQRMLEQQLLEVGHRGLLLAQRKLPPAPRQAGKPTRSAASRVLAAASTARAPVRIVQRQQNVGFQLRHLVNKDAVWIAIGESVQQRLGAGVIARIVVRLGRQKIRDSRQFFAVLPRQPEVRPRLGVALVQQIGMTQRQISRRRRIAGVLAAHTRSPRHRPPACAAWPVAAPWPQFARGNKCLPDARRPRRARGAARPGPCDWLACSPMPAAGRFLCVCDSVALDAESWKRRCRLP